MKLDELRRLLRERATAEDTKNDTCGDTKPPPATTSAKHAPVTKRAETCNVCRHTALVGVYQCEPLFVQDIGDGPRMVTLGEWWCTHCGAHFITKLSP